MKKFFYVAMMVLTMGVMASCNNGSTPAKAPVIDEEKSTVNGKQYDNKTEKCWLFTYEVSYEASGAGVTAQRESEKGSEHLWMTEFQAQVLKANWDYETNAHAQGWGVSVTVKSSSSIKEVSAKDADSCYALDD